MDGVVLTNETKELVLDLATAEIKPKTPVLLRLLVKPALSVALNTIDTYAAKVIPDKIDLYINTAIVKINEKDYDSAAAALGTAADELVDIPTIDDVHERNMFVTIFQAIVNSIVYIVEKKKAE